MKNDKDSVTFSLAWEEPDLYSGTLYMGESSPCFVIRIVYLRSSNAVGGISELAPYLRDNFKF